MNQQGMMNNGQMGMQGYNQMQVPMLDVAGGGHSINMGSMNDVGLGVAVNSQDQETGVDNSQSQGTSQGQHQQASEFNIPVMCHIGQETIQEIVFKASELFQLLRNLQPPTASINQQAEERKKQGLQEILRVLQNLFKRLRRVFEICDENCSGGEYATLEPDVVTMQLIPLEDEETKSKKERIDDDSKKTSEYIKALMDERDKLEQQVNHKNKQLKEIIDMLRNIVWEINTMLCMRKKHLPFSNKIASFKPKPIY